MSSSIPFLAYALTEREPPEVTAVRVRHVENRVAQLHASSLERTSVGDGASGFVGWTPSRTSMAWCPFSAEDDSGTAWLHVPGLAGGPETGVTEKVLARELFEGRVRPADLGAPFAAIRWSEGVLQIANDMLGLVRLFHFEFSGGTVWSTRSDLAHVFMGEEPVRNEIAWAGMAALGWATSGHTQLGHGKQLRGGTQVVATWGADGRRVSVSGHLADWFRTVREDPCPSADDNVRDMERLMSTARRWPRPAVADLSGGKDSRVVAAVGIRAGAVRAVRTILTDKGEVETAQQLMRSIDTDVEHIIEPRRAARSLQGNFLECNDSQHQAWEGRFLATSAFNSAPFTGFRPIDQARFNGLGGECVAGGALVGGWQEKLTGAPAQAAVDRFAAMARSAKEATPEARAVATEDIGQYVDLADQMGVDTPIGVLDIAYLLDRMPNWSNVFTGASTLCPLFAPSLLTVAAQRAGNPQTADDFHRQVLAAAIPAWADVPFYKSMGVRTRATAFVWEHPEWPDIRDYVLTRLESSAVYDSAAVSTTLAEIQRGEGTKRHEVLVHRLLWDLRFDVYVDAVAEMARCTARDLENHRQFRRASAP